jgi:D-sedoheptulose 7-phosphate isomerase
MAEFAESYLKRLNEVLAVTDIAKIDQIISIILDAARNDKQIFVIGNGGSAATASHFACDLGKGTVSKFFDPSQRRIRVIPLTDSVPLLTAYGNDLEYQHIFSQQLNNLVNPGDVVIGISASGNSKNVINAIKFANTKNATTIGLLGFDGGQMKSIVDHALLFEDNHFGRVEDAHMVAVHIIAYAVADVWKKQA